jgi:4-hydroxybenzoate polyprenyltransferase
LNHSWPIDFLTLFGALAGRFGLLHLLAVLSALAYNLKLKSTPLSFLPYLFSFGLLPIIVLGATKYPIETWMAAIGALFGVGAHLANVFKDLEQDRESGIFGLPQILGTTYARIGCALCFGGGAFILFATTSRKEALVIVLTSTIFLLPIPRKYVFPFAMVLGISVMSVFISAISA